MVSFIDKRRLTNASDIEGMIAWVPGVNPDDEMIALAWNSETNYGTDPYGCTSTPNIYHHWLVKKSDIDAGGSYPVPHINLRGTECSDKWGHYFTYIPRKRWLYESGFKGTNCSGPKFFTIYDLTNPSSPKIIKDFEGASTSQCGLYFAYYAEEVDKWLLVDQDTLQAKIATTDQLLAMTSWDQLPNAPANPTKPLCVTVGGSKIICAGVIYDLKAGTTSTFPDEELIGASLNYVITRPSGWNQNISIKWYKKTDLTLAYSQTTTLGQPPWGPIVIPELDSVLIYPYFGEANNTIYLLKPDGTLMSFTLPRSVEMRLLARTKGFFTIATRDGYLSYLLPDSYLMINKEAGKYVLRDMNNNPVPNKSVVICQQSSIAKIDAEPYGYDECTTVTTDANGVIPIPSTFIGKSFIIIAPP